MNLVQNTDWRAAAPQELQASQMQSSQKDLSQHHLRPQNVADVSSVMKTFIFLNRFKILLEAYCFGF